MDVVLGTRLRGERVLIILDVEGAEQQVLEGASIMLANNPKPVWVVEIMTTDHQPRGIGMNPNLKSTFQLFFRNGYQAFNFDRDMRPVTMEHIELVSRGRLTFPTHNFLFCHLDTTKIVQLPLI
jgi:hypothetical protein